MQRDLQEAYQVVLTVNIINQRLFVQWALYIPYQYLMNMELR